MASQLLYGRGQIFSHSSPKCLVPVSGPNHHHSPVNRRRTSCYLRTNKPTLNATIVAPRKELKSIEPSPSSTNVNTVRKYYPFFKVLKDGSVERFMPMAKVPPVEGPDLPVQTKDVIVSPESGVSARIFLPAGYTTKKLPLVVYYHGGGLSAGSTFSSLYHNYLQSLACEGGAIVVSVEYRLAPEYPVPACYDDSWEALKWVASHVGGDGPETWLNMHADFSWVFLMGESAGANIVHNVAVRAGLTGLPGLELSGMALVHPYFAGVDYYDNIWFYICPENDGPEDRRIKPDAVDLASIQCGRVLVLVAGDDRLRNVGTSYCKELKKSEWKGEAEIVEHKGEGHVFHLANPHSENATGLMTKLVAFINHIC